MGLGLAVGAYLLVALLAMIPTCIEQHANGVEGPLRRSVSLLACLLWPLPLVAIVVLVLHQAPRDEAAQVHARLSS